MTRKIFDIYRISIAFFALVFFLFSGETGWAKLNAIASSDNASLSAAVFAGEAVPSQSQIVLQKYIGHCACGPCAIFNSFQFGDASMTNLARSLPGKTRADKVRSLIGLFGGKPSAMAGNQPRYLANGGMWGADIAPLINDWLGDSGPLVRGERLTLGWNETPREQVQRVYDELRHSLEQGFPPVVNLQSYTAPGTDSRAGWTWLDGHFVTVVAVQDSLAKHASGFSMWVADSESGRLLQVSVSAGQDPFRAITSERVDRNGREIDSWTAGHPYLTIRSSKLEGILEGNASSPQTICVLQYVAHR